MVLLLLILFDDIFLLHGNIHIWRIGWCKSFQKLTFSSAIIWSRRNGVVNMTQQRFCCFFSCSMLMFCFCLCLMLILWPEVVIRGVVYHWSMVLHQVSIYELYLSVKKRGGNLIHLYWICFNILPRVTKSLQIGYPFDIVGERCVLPTN